MTVGSILIVSCWAFLCIFWIITSFSAKHIRKSQGLGERLTWGLLYFLSYVLLLEGLNSQSSNNLGILQPIYPLYLQVLDHSNLVVGIGFIITLGGLLLTLWARHALGVNWSVSVSVKDNHELIQKGPYGYVRHPIYTGMILMFMGTAIAIGNLGGFISIPVLIASLWIKLKQEEALMIQQFKGKYLSYMKRVKAIIPYVL